jgi:hypothetical protein
VDDMDVDTLRYLVKQMYQQGHAGNVVQGIKKEDDYRIKEEPYSFGSSVDPSTQAYQSEARPWAQQTAVKTPASANSDYLSSTYRPPSTRPSFSEAYPSPRSAVPPSISASSTTDPLRQNAAKEEDLRQMCISASLQDLPSHPSSSFVHQEVFPAFYKSQERAMKRQEAEAELTRSRQEQMMREQSVAASQYQSTDPSTYSQSSAIYLYGRAVNDGLPNSGSGIVIDGLPWTREQAGMPAMRFTGVEQYFAGVSY